MQQHFGTGTIFAAATQDAFGATIANPTPVKFGILQDVSIEFDRDIKELYGQLAFPVAVAGGKMKIAIKAKFAQILGRIFNDMFLGQGMTAGVQTAVVEDLTGSAIPTTPFQITVTPPNSGTFLRDLGVLNASGVPLQRVVSAPATGQYSLAGAVYTFAAADVGLVVYPSYAYTFTLASAKAVTFNNIAMGTVPVFGIDLPCKYNGKTAYFRLSNCVAKKLSFDPKQDDFAMQDMDIVAFADPVTNAIGSIVLAE
jgi:hypothetical protein